MDGAVCTNQTKKQSINQNSRNMITEASSVAESLMKQYRSISLPSEEYAEREREAQAREIREKAAKILQASHLPKRHLTTKEAELHGDEWLENKRGLESMLNKRGAVLSIIGPRGTGKTQMAVSLARSQANLGRSVYYTTAMGLFMDLRASFGGAQKTSDRDAIKPFISPSLLIIDEIQVRSDTPFEDAKLTHLIDARYADMKDTIIISNLKAEALAASVGDSAMSRSKEGGGLLELNCGNYRIL